MALLEGLEVSEVKLSELENSIFRFDAEYFKKIYLSEDSQRKKHSNEHLGNNAFITDGQHGYHEVDEKSEIRHLTAKNFKNWFANIIDADRLAKWVDDKNKRSSLKVNDVVLTTRGTVGFCALVKKEVLPANIDQDVARISITKILAIKPEYLVTYINSRFGQDWTRRNQTGMVQQGLALWRVKEFPIPILSSNFQDKISEIIEKSHNSIISSQQTYTQAENLLLETLGLKNFKPGKEKVNIKSFKESFLTTGRLDAEYYQVKYEEVIAKIKDSNYERLVDLVNIKKSIEPGSNAYSEEGLPFLRVADYNKFGVSEPQKCLSDTYIKENSEKLSDLKPKAETILFSKDGSVGTAYMLKENMNLISSGAVLHLTVKNKEKVLPEYLTLVLNSQLVKMQAERDAGGSIILHWRVGEIENVVIPIIDFKNQQQISDKIEESFRLKKQSEKLLEMAKQAVEMAIEESEEKAMGFIEENLNLINGK